MLEISGNFIANATSTSPTLSNLIPNSTLGCEYADSLILASIFVTSKIGSKLLPPHPVAELWSGLMISADTFAPSGKLASNPKSAVAVPANVAEVPTS